MWEFNLVKLAEEKNTKKYKKVLNSKDTDIAARHSIPLGAGIPALLEALRGGNAEDLVLSNYDGAKLVGSSLLGALGGGFVGAKLGDENNLTQQILGGVAGALGGGWLGNYLSFKTMAHNRDVDSSYRLRHLTPFGIPAQLAALKGYDADALVKSNIDSLMLQTGIAGGKLAGAATGTIAGLGSPLATATGALTGAGVGNLAVYKALKDRSIKEEED